MLGHGLFFLEGGQCSLGFLILRFSLLCGSQLSGLDLLGLFSFSYLGNLGLFGLFLSVLGVLGSLLLGNFLIILKLPVVGLFLEPGHLSHIFGSLLDGYLLGFSGLLSGGSGCKLCSLDFIFSISAFFNHTEFSF